MSYLGFRERIELRRAVAAGVNKGKLPQSAAFVLSNRDAFAELERHVYEQVQTDVAAGWSPNAADSSPAHPILAWIVSHAPQILAFVLAILPLFGVNVPPINIPAPPAPGGSAGDPTTPIPHSSASNPTQPGCRGRAAAGPCAAVPPAAALLAPLVEQIAAQVVAALLPQIEAKIEGWVKSHLPTAA